MNRLFIFAAAAAILFFNGLTAPISAQAPPTGAVVTSYKDAIVAAVGDETITIYDLDKEVAPQLQALARLPRGKNTDVKVEELRKDVANHLIETELLWQEFKTRGFKLPLDLLQKRIDGIVFTQAGGSRERFEKQLFDQGLSWSEFEEKLRKNMAADLLVDEFIRRPVHVSPESVRAWYDTHAPEFTIPARIQLSLILLKLDGKYAGKLDETVAKIQAQLAEKADFGWLAKQYSEVPETANGGDLGWMDEASVQKEFAEAVRGLKRGETAKPFQAPAGRVLLKVTDREDTRLEPFNTATAQRIEALLRSDAEKVRYDAFIGQLKQRYPVTIFF